jgi:hypothetical protein
MVSVGSSTVLARKLVPSELRRFAIVGGTCGRARCPAARASDVMSPPAQGSIRRGCLKPVAAQGFWARR